ncbi:MULTISPECIES: FHA domain-containing protein [unclassified Nodularia (in: cyanobacteria)]|uniref:FHA domain-containing protein n=1 Tax=unclassified Nodularia (in: cyanobacteria) TaxID=2656917 RepID=UPI0018815DF8|nr:MULTISPECIES: FHA domain-containing protein [unclassified Nodularia (in: cyanobacteria)]MBE9198699.1 FHA domain-containing protein [Nodularia sp. LEGE 06071]MCC2694585.1 FHA domain-containing protein [Nodularia sp. LEGE 04288]
MIVCPNCNHPNPDGAVQCEACYTPLPTTSNCPNCGATVQADAAFCGQCGYNLHSSAAPAAATSVATVAPDISIEVPPLIEPDPLLELLQPDALGINSDPNPPAASPLPPTAISVSPPEASAPPTPTVAAEPIFSEPEVLTPPPEPEPEPEPVAMAAPEPEPEPEPVAVETPAPEPEPVAVAPSPAPFASMTQLQQVTARLFHVQSDREIELPQTLSVIHIGKPNDRIPPDVDVSGFSNSEIVSRIHADIRIEGDSHYIEDVGSSNGTYINNSPLLPGNRHRLRAGDRISLGKGDLVTFLFQLA